VASYPALDLKFALGPGAGTFQDILYAELDDFEPVAIHEHEAGDSWRVFFRTAAQRDAARVTLASEFGNALFRAVAVDVDDEDWARRSQASLTAVRVGRVIVAPPWVVPRSRDSRPATSDSSESQQFDTIPNREARAASREEITIVIDPSTGFGTGHHATTRLCLELLQKRDVSGARVIDVGTGSGVLAIAAWKLGAAHVVAIDNDPDALQNAQDNVVRNGATGAIDVVNLDLSSVSLERAQIVMANLTASVIQRHASTLRKLVVTDGILILSGFSGDEIEGVASTFGAMPEDTLIEGEWAAISVRNSRDQD
jgi:ribosomal protein L11 methyltransferase